MEVTKDVEFYVIACYAKEDDGTRNKGELVGYLEHQCGEPVLKNTPRASTHYDSFAETASACEKLSGKEYWFYGKALRCTAVMACVEERNSRFLDEITRKQAAFASLPIDDAELNAAAEAILSRIKKLTDDPYNYSVSQVTINYVAVNDDKGTCKFWLDDNQKDILFNMTVPHFEALVSNIHTKYGFGYSGSFGQREGHVHLRWSSRR